MDHRGDDVSPAYGMVTSGVGAMLLVAGLGFLLASLMAMTRAWRGGLPWWSGGLIWFTPSRQPPAARPHMRTALRRWLAAIPCLMAAVALLSLAGT
ncbi:hypothetical protein GXW71_16125 [Roseomonas hellenica]|uniref:Uncharacterized protein n=1 Tax=Plastoroseomonas hellenica TaxID=2687306 RepID=A0ABS5F003_9PROT|nr:hypothetical protein [Plastoroseomonas hellenica]MBR0665886.1 hypothetical protein [Plastoroseomonas hellenica]